MTAPEPLPARVILYWSAIWRGAVTTGTFAVPIALLGGWLVDSNRIEGGDAIVYLLNLIVLFCGAAGGYAAAKLSPTSLIQNGAAAAGLASITISVAGAVRRTIAGDDVSNPLGWILLALLMATAGMFGGYILRRTSVRPPDSQPNAHGNGDPR